MFIPDDRNREPETSQVCQDIDCTRPATTTFKKRRLCGDCADYWIDGYLFDQRHEYSS